MRKSESSSRMSESNSRVNAVFYANTYHPIQAGSIDGTDTLSHDNGIYRALLCSNAGLYDPFGDPKVVGDSYCTVFVGCLSHLTTEDTLRKAMSKYGKVKNLRLVRHIVTGASRGYAFVEYETEREMRRAYESAHHTFIDDSEIIVDYNRQRLMPGWIPRRLGGGLGGKKESGQLRFGGRERPFRAPLRPIPLDDLKRLGIEPPPEGRYVSRFQVPSPPRRKRSFMDREDSLHKHCEHSKHSNRCEKRSTSWDHSSDERRPVDKEERTHENQKHGKHSHGHRTRPSSRDHLFNERSSMDKGERSHDHHKYSKYSHRHKTRYSSRDRVYVEGSFVDREEGSHKRENNSKHYDRHERWSPGEDRTYEG